MVHYQFLANKVERITLCLMWVGHNLINLILGEGWSFVYSLPSIGRIRNNKAEIEVVRSNLIIAEVMTFDQSKV